MLILIDCFLFNSYPCVLFESLSLVLSRNHMFIHEIWGKFTSFIFRNLSQFSLLNMWLLVQIFWIFSEHLFSRTPLSGCFWLMFSWFVFLIFGIPDILKVCMIFHSSCLGFLRKSLQKVFFLGTARLWNSLHVHCFSLNSDLDFLKTIHKQELNTSSILRLG